MLRTLFHRHHLIIWNTGVFLEAEEGTADPSLPSPCHLWFYRPSSYPSFTHFNRQQQTITSFAHCSFGRYCRSFFRVLAIFGVFFLPALILSSETQQHKPHPQFAPWGYRVAHDEPFQSHRILQKFLSAMEWLEKGGKKSHQLWQTLLHASLQCTSQTVSLLMCFISLLLPTLASLAKTCQDLVAFLPLSLWTHVVFRFNEGNSAENADKRKILIQLWPLARYKWRGQWDRAGAPRRGISGDWSHARWEPRALCRGLLRTWVERNPLCVRDAQADRCNSINFSFWHFLSAVFSVCIISCMKPEKSQPSMIFLFFLEQISPWWEMGEIGPQHSCFHGLGFF